MNRLLYAFALTIAFVGFVGHVWAGGGGKHRHRWGNNVSVNTDSEAPGDACDDHFNVTFDDAEVFTAEEAKTLTPAEFSGGLEVRGPHNGGMLVRGWDRNEVLVKACKAVAASSDGEANGMLERVKLSINGRTITATGPDTGDGQRWWVHLMVNVPKNIKLAMDTHNGPIAVRNVTGTVNAETVNGPLSIHRCAGEITAEAQNGPIDVVRSSGNIRVRTQNGPLDIELAGTEWSGRGLEASAQNGPLKLHIPRNYVSGVEVVARGYSPFHCATDACSDAQKDWDDRDRTVRLGKAGQPTLVHMSTVNGPVSIVSTMQ